VVRNTGLSTAAGGRGFGLDVLTGAHAALTQRAQTWLFLAFFLALATKSAFFPVHSWLPAAQGAAPTSAAVALGIKVGTYGMLRFALPLLPAAVLNPVLRTTLVGLAVVGIIYGALVAFVQPDLRRVASYASVSHLGFVVLGIFALTAESLQGAMLVMVSHGVSIGALFLLAGMLEDRTGSTSVEGFGGLARSVPLFSACSPRSARWGSPARTASWGSSSCFLARSARSRARRCWRPWA
jgi:NADH-quinone oxidoreductase subunit M